MNRKVWGVGGGGGGGGGGEHERSTKEYLLFINFCI